jgi:hypothetical protein
MFASPAIHVNSRIFGNPVTQSAFTSPLELERHALFVQVGLV